MGREEKLKQGGGIPPPFSVGYGAQFVGRESLGVRERELPSPAGSERWGGDRQTLNISCAGGGGGGAGTQPGDGGV